jgi:hypothetical protein
MADDKFSKEESESRFRAALLGVRKSHWKKPKVKKAVKKANTAKQPSGP